MTTEEAEEELNTLNQRATELALQLDALANCVQLVGSEAAARPPRRGRSSCRRT